MRQNRASRFNRNMMVMMIFMGIVVIGCVYAFLYISLPMEQPEREQNIGEYTDSATLVIDSIAN